MMMECDSGNYVRKGCVFLLIVALIAVVMTAMILSSSDGWHRFGLTKISLETSGGNMTTAQSNETVAKAEKIPSEHHKLPQMMSILKQGRLGNNLFQYAALRGLAASSNHEPVLRSSFEYLRKIFQIKTRLLGSINHTQLRRTRFVKYVEQRPLPLVNVTIRNISRMNISILLDGFFESHLYFKDINDDLRQELVLQESLKVNTVHAMKHILGVKTLENLTLVGIHIRIGDMTRNHQNKGWIFPPLVYFNHAMAYFTKKYISVRFIICSDNKLWAEHHLLNTTSNVFLSHEKDGQSDFAILMSCNHVITSRGTFGWWAGWLVKGETIYYKHYHPKGSRAAIYHPKWSYIPRDVYNHWKAME